MCVILVCSQITSSIALTKFRCAQLPTRSSVRSVQRSRNQRDSACFNWRAFAFVSTPPPVFVGCQRDDSKLLPRASRRWGDGGGAETSPVAPVETKNQNIKLMLRVINESARASAFRSGQHRALISSTPTQPATPAPGSTVLCALDAGDSVRVARRANNFIY